MFRANTHMRWKASGQYFMLNGVIWDTVCSRVFSSVSTFNFANGNDAVYVLSGCWSRDDFVGMDELEERNSMSS